MSPATCSRPMKGWVRACFTATAAIELCFMFGLLVPVPRFSAGGVVAIVFWMFALAPLVWLVTSALTGIPALLAIRLSERFRIQSVLFFICIGGGIGALIPALLFRSFTILSSLFAAAGCLAGLSYWYVAGRYAGQDDPLAETC